MQLRTTLASLLLAAVVPLAAACGTADVANSATATRPGGPGGVDVGSVTSEAQLVELIQAAHGDSGLGLHRGHRPVEDVLDEILAVSHGELHGRMDTGQNLAAVAEDIGVDPQTLIDALVESWSPAIDAVLASGAITEEEADRYREALEEAFSFRVSWDGQQATPTFSGLDA